MMHLPLPMVDLKSQYQKIKPEVDAAIATVLDSAAFIAGTPVQAFSKDLENYINLPHVITCGNGTDALQIALMALDLQPGDEVITPSFTYIATVEVVALLKLKPVFVDVDLDTFTMCPKALLAAITANTKAIIPVHLYGQSAAMSEILAIASERNIPVIEDNAQAIGGHYIFPDGTKTANGSMGLIGTTSFFPSKNLGCYGDGGAIFTHDDALAKKMKMIANHGQSVRYYHEMVGCNSRLDTIQAAVLQIKLKHLDAYCNARRAAADYYDKAFETCEWIKTPPRASYSYHVFHQYTIVLHDSVNRDLLQQYLTELGIPTMIYYPVPCHKQNMFNHIDNSEIHLPNTDYLTPRVLSLPIHTEMTNEMQDYIITHVLKSIEKSRL